MAENILIADQDLEVRENISSLLEEEGYKCIKADSGLKALHHVETEKVDLIIADVSMPELDGFGLIEKLQTTAKYNSIPFILLATKVSTESLRKGMNLGIDEYLTKPFKVNDLMKAVKIRLTKKENHSRNDRKKEDVIRYIPQELRSPFISILSYSNLLKKRKNNPLDGHSSEMISNVSKSGSHLLGRIEKFLYLAELENDDSSSRLNGYYTVTQESSLKAMLYSPDIAERLNDLFISIQEAKVSIPEKYFMMMLKEIISNACKFSDLGTRIVMSGKYRDNGYMLRILDRGDGISEKEIKKIMKTSLYGIRRVSDISDGLGLVVVNKILSVYKGQLSINSVGNKTLVKVWIPCNSILQFN